MYYMIEGVDGCGKTTVMKAVARLLLEEGQDNFVLTKEPGGPKALWTEWGEPAELKPYFGKMYDTGPMIRELCVNHPEIPQLAKRALFKSDSLCNWTHVIKPAVAGDGIVISDRGWISDLVYGSILCKMDVHALFQFNMALTPQLHSMTHVIYLHVPTAIREARLTGNVVDHMDKLGPEIRDELAKAYHRIVPDYAMAGQFWSVDASRDVQTVARDIVDIITGD